MTAQLVHAVWITAAVLLILVILPSIRIIAANEVGLVIKRFTRKKLAEGNIVAFKGEAGYQADLLMPGWRFKVWWLYRVEKHPFAQIPSGEIGLVIAGNRCRWEPRPQSIKRCSAISAICAALWRTAVNRACSDRCCRPDRSCLFTRSAFW